MITRTNTMAVCFAIVLALMGLSMLTNSHPIVGGLGIVGRSALGVLFLIFGAWMVSAVGRGVVR